MEEGCPWNVEHHAFLSSSLTTLSPLTIHSLFFFCSPHSTSFFFFLPSSSTCGFSTSSLHSGGKGRGWRKEDEDRETVYLWKPVQRITAFLHRSYEKRERVCDGSGGGGG